MTPEPDHANSAPSRPRARRRGAVFLDRALAAGRHTADALAGLMLLSIFLLFLLQIYARFAGDDRFGWTLQLSLAIWIWLVFFGCALVVREQDHIKFDILYLAAPRAVRRVCAVISSLAIAFALYRSIDPTLQSFQILKLKRAPTLTFRFDEPIPIPLTGLSIDTFYVTNYDVFIIYVGFLIVLCARYVLRAGQAAVLGPPEERGVAAARLGRENGREEGAA